MKTIAYIRVSKDSQDIQNQRHSILEYANQRNFKVDKFIELSISSRRSSKDRKIDELLDQLHPQDKLIVSEISRLGRSVGQIIQIVDRLIKKEIIFTAIKENITINGKPDINTKVMITMFSLFAEIERDLISQRTREALASAKAQGKQLGRPKGTTNSKLDGRVEEIQKLLGLKVSKPNIAKIMGVGKTAIYHFIKTRNLEK